MKRIWLGFGVLAALIAVGVWSMFAADAIHGDMARQLHQAAYRTDSRQAFDTSQQVQRQWERYFLFTATMADHTDVDEIDALFAQMEVCRTRGDEINHALLCAALSECLTALSENHVLSWANLL